MNTLSPRLTTHRLPGEYGPVLLCSGELAAATKEALVAELGGLEVLGHPVVTLDVTDCTIQGAEAVEAIYHAARQLAAAGSHLAIVAGGGRTARMLELLGVAKVVPMFPT